MRRGKPPREHRRQMAVAARVCRGENPADIEGRNRQTSPYSSRHHLSPQHRTKVGPRDFTTHKVVTEATVSRQQDERQYDSRDSADALMEAGPRPPSTTHAPQWPAVEAGVHGSAAFHPLAAPPARTGRRALGQRAAAAAAIGRPDAERHADVALLTCEAACRPDAGCR